MHHRFPICFISFPLLIDFVAGFLFFFCTNAVVFLLSFCLLSFGVVYDMDICSGGYILPFVYFFVSFVTFFFYVYSYDSIDHLG